MVKKLGRAWCVSVNVGPMGTAVVVCPLRFERRVLGRAGIGRSCELVCCGAGAAAARRWAADHVASGPVILCGLAGALNSAFDVGTAHAAVTVVGEDGRRMEPSLREHGGPVLACPPRTLTTPQARRAWSAGSGADLADLESAAFAHVAVEKGWRWAIVRGVSDGPDDALPADIDDWVDGKGRTRVSLVVRRILRRPERIGPLLRLRADSVAAMEAVAVVVRSMLEGLGVRG